MILNNGSPCQRLTMKPSSDIMPGFTKKYFLLVMALPIIFWAFAFPFIKIGLQELSPINLTIMRLFTVCAIFLLFILIAPKKFSKLHKEDIIPLFLLGFLGIVVYHLGLNYGEQYMSASAASLIIATIPIFMVIFAVIFLKEKITKKIGAGVLLSLSGVIIISLVGTTGNPLEITYLTSTFFF
jgi:drug/metabolite transporter (DMT)-like permease